MPPHLDQLITDLNNENPNVRIVAAELLSRSDAPEALPLLLKAFEDTDPDVRRVAARSLGTLADPTAISLLIRALDDKAVHNAAAQALEAFAGNEYLSYFKEALTASSPNIRKVAISILGHTHTNDVLTCLTEAVSDESWEVRKNALRAISQFDAPVAASSLLRALSDERIAVRTMAAGLLKKNGKSSAIPLLLEALDHEDEFVRHAVVAALGAMNDTSVIVPILGKFADPSEMVRNQAAQALQIRQEPVVINLLVKALKHENATVCELACDTLKAFDAETITGPLTDVFFDDGFHDRRYVIELLSTRGGAQAVTPLINALNEPDAEVRSLAATALRLISPTEIIQPLIDTLSQNRIRDKNAAIELLGTLNHPDILPPLLAALHDEVPYVRAKAARALDAYPQPIPPDQIVGFLDAASSSLRKLAYRLLGRSQDNGAIQLLLDRIDTAPKSEHIEIIQALGTFQSREVASILSRLLLSEHFAIRHAAVEALYPMQAFHALSPLLNYMKNWDNEAMSTPVHLMVTLYLEGKRELSSTLGRALSFHRLERNIRETQRLHLTDQKGVEALDALRELISQNEWRHLGFFLSREFTGLGYLMVKVSKLLYSTHQLQKKDASLLVCTQHLTRFIRFRKNSLIYLGCRICEQTHTVAKTESIIAVLDIKMEPELVATESSFRVNWLIQRRLYDYDTVEIGPCSEESITEFCIDMGNDPDPHRMHPFRKIQCVIRPGISISEQTLAILKRHFKRVIQQ